MRGAESLFSLVTLGLLALGAGCSSGGGPGANAGASGAGASATTSASGAGTGAGTSAPGTTAGLPPPLAFPAPPAGGSAAPSRFLYTANYGDSSLTALGIDAVTGAPTVLGSVATGDAPLRVVAHPAGKLLYAIERSEITAFAIDAVGGLAQIGAPLTIAGDYPLSARVSPDGKLLVAGYYGGGPGGSVRSFTIGAGGDLVAADRYALGATANPVDVVVHPGGRFVFAADGISETITVLALDPLLGRLAPVGAPVACPGVAALALDGKGAFLVAMTSLSPGSVSVFAVDSSGAITPRGAPVSTGPHSAMAIETAPDGRTFQVVTASSSLVTLALDAQGGLTTSRVTAIPAQGFPCGLAVDASGRFVFTANFAGDDISVLEVGASGVVIAGTNVAIAPRTPGGTTQPSWVVTVR